MCMWNEFPPKSNSNLWRPNNFNRLPNVFYDKARQDMFKCVQDEIECVVERFQLAEVLGDPEGTEKAVYIFFGPRSSTYHVFSKIFPKEDYEFFARFMAAFFFASSEGVILLRRWRSLALVSCWLLPSLNCALAALSRCCKSMQSISDVRQSYRVFESNRD